MRQLRVVFMKESPKIFHHEWLNLKIIFKRKIPKSFGFMSTLNELQ